MLRYFNKKNLEQLSKGVAATLAVPFGKKIEKAVSTIIDDTSPTAYDAKIDEIYNQTHIGGGNHRLFDGSHTPSAMWEKVKEALPDDSRTDEIKNYFLSMFKDLQTVKGIPLTNIENKASYDQAVQSLSGTFGISKSWFHDILTVNLSEFFSTTIGVMAFIFKWKEREKKEFTQLASALLTAAAVGANPFLFIVSLISLGSSYTKVKRKKDFQKNFIKGTLGMGSFILAASMFSSPLLGLVFGICVAITVKKKLDTIDEQEIIKWVKNKFKEHKELIIGAAAGVGIASLTGI